MHVALLCKKDPVQPSKCSRVPCEVPGPALDEEAEADRPSAGSLRELVGESGIPGSPSAAEAPGGAASPPLVDAFPPACCAESRWEPPRRRGALTRVVPSPRSLFGSLQEERVQDADSVWRQRWAHQQHSCTLDECFQFYTKEEQVGPGGSTPPGWDRWVGHVHRAGPAHGPRGFLSSWLRTTHGSVRTARPSSRAW